MPRIAIELDTLELKALVRSKIDELKDDIDCARSDGNANASWLYDRISDESEVIYDLCAMIEEAETPQSL